MKLFFSMNSSDILIVSFSHQGVVELGGLDSLQVNGCR